MSDLAEARAQNIVAPSVRELGELARALEGWLAARMPEARDIAVSNLAYPRGAGMSHETILFDAAWREGGESREQGMVVRIKPTTELVFLDDLFDRQFALMRLMADASEVKVARPLWLEEDPALLGAPFFVMAKVQGRVAVSYPPYAREGWLFDAAPADRRVMWEDAVRQLALIQKVPVEAAPFLTLPGGDDGCDQEVDRWRRFVDWVDPEANEKVLRDAFAQLLAQRPASYAPGIVWGDARLGNMMIGPDFRVTAVMDWEQPSLGGALHDLGWWLQSDENMTTRQGLARLDGMGTREETIALWAEVSGKPTADIAWFEAFACFKMEALSVRMQALRGAVRPAGTFAGQGTLKLLGL